MGRRRPKQQGRHWRTGQPKQQFGVVVARCVAARDVGAAREVAREVITQGLRWDAPALSELVGALRPGGHLAWARELLLEDILRDGCAAGLDASAFSS
ncbi:unnamed protein product [Urochloa humidicola]